jgi:hypothetical protein
MTALLTYIDWAAHIAFALFLTFGVVWVGWTLVWFVRMIFGRAA